jgi:hypothetical protein
VIALFLAAILAPSVDSMIRPDAARSPEQAEQRRAAPRPKLGLELAGLLAYPDAFANYFEDSFGLRDVLLRWHSLEKLFVFGVSPSSAVVLGRDDWMFYTRDQSMEIFRGVSPFTTRELETWRRSLESRRDYLARRGIKFLYVIGPNKETIYPDYAPTNCNRVGPTRMDQLVEYLEAHSKLRILDLRPAFRAARPDDQPLDHLYYELGTHWNGRGGFLACREIQKYLHTIFPSIHVSESSDVVFAVASDRGDSEARWMYVEDLFPQRHIWYEPAGKPRARSLTGAWDSEHLHVVEVDDPHLPRAVIFHDSFGPGVEPELAECFSRSTWMSTNSFDTQAVEQEKPQIVIEIHVERVLLYGDVDILPDTGPAATNAADARSVHFELQPRGAPLALEAKGTTLLDQGHDQDGDYASVLMRDGADTFLLPAFEWPARKQVVVDVDVTAPFATELTLFYLRADDAAYERRCSVSVALTQGRNHASLAIPRNGMHGRLMIRPGAELGRYVLHGLRARAADAR